MDDCWAAAVATCLQVPINDVPDPQLDKRLQAGDSPGLINRAAWDEFASWLSGRGLSMTFHGRRLPAHRRRWIGVVPRRGDFNDHCLVMSREEVLFDPVESDGTSVFTSQHVRLGYSFRAMPSVEQ